jgi:hypothetical protein
VVDEIQLANALQSMVEDQHPETGAVISVARVLYGYER